MGTVSTSLPADGQTIDASDVNTPINAILSEFNGNIDDNNIKSAANINGSKILAASISGSKLDTTAQGGWIASALPAVSSVTENGNRSADITFASTVASILTPGMRLRTSRTVAAPTQCTSLNGTTQYWVKTSPNKLTFTDDFVVSAWVKLSSYPSNIGVVASRYNGTSGFTMFILSTGTVVLQGLNGGAGNTSDVRSYQSIPLNKWVHITAQLDMSAFTATSTTSYVMIDGVDVPAQVTRAGTNPTALVQAGNLEIGAHNSGAATTLFPGKIAQVAIFNAKVTQSTIRTYKNQGLSGSETSLASAYSFNNSIADLNTSTPNDLSAGAGSPTATNADSPFTQDANGTPGGTYDYAIVTKVSTTTATVQCPEGCAIPTSGGISTVDLSPHKAPFGFPSSQVRWVVQMVIGTPASSLGTGTATTYAFGASGQEIKITAPVGDWCFDGGLCGLVTANASYPDLYLGFSTSTSAYTSDGSKLAQRAVINGGNTSNTHLLNVKVQDNISLSTATPYYVLIRSGVATTGMQLRGAISSTPETSYAALIPAHL